MVVFDSQVVEGTFCHLQDVPCVVRVENGRIVEISMDERAEKCLVVSTRDGRVALAFLTDY